MACEKRIISSKLIVWLNVNKFQVTVQPKLESWTVANILMGFWILKRGFSLCYGADLGWTNEYKYLTEKNLYGNNLIFIK